MNQFCAQAYEAGGPGVAVPPPSLIRFFLLRFCFTNILIFSCHLSLATCIKTHTKTQEMPLKRPHFQNILGEPPRGSRAEGTSRQICVRPQKFLSPYAYGSVIQLAGCIYYPHREEVEDNWKIQGRGKKLRNVSWKSREGARNVVSNWKSREGGKKCCLEI